MKMYKHLIWKEKTLSISYRCVYNCQAYRFTRQNVARGIICIMPRECPSELYMHKLMYHQSSDLIQPSKTVVVIIPNSL